MRLTTVYLYGQLAEWYGDRHEFVLTTHKDVVAAMTASFPDFRHRILELERQGFGYQLTGTEDIGADELGLPVTSPVLHLSPVVAGSGGIGKIITGAVLIGAGFLMGGFGGGLLAKGLIGVGASLALRGVNQVFSPPPPTLSNVSNGSSQQEANSIFGGGQGVSSFRSPIPLIYGEFRIDQPAILSSGSYAVWIPSTDNYLKNETTYGVVAALSEGEIQGYSTADPQQSIYLDNTPLRSANGANNFGETVEVGITYGTAGQVIPPTIGNVLLTETLVGINLQKGIPITRTIAGDYVGFWIKLQIQSMFEQNNVEVLPIDLYVSVEVSTDGGAFTKIFTKRWNGKTTQPFDQTFKFSLPTSISQSWDIRVTKITEDSTDRKRTDIAWSSVTGVARRTSNYANVALLGLDIDAQYLSNSPPLKIDLKGIKVRVPHNYNAATRAYAGTFNGTLAATKVWTSNPVWILYDLLTNSRYGVGLSASEVDVYSFYAASVYCDELVDDGDGGREPRFTFNAAITQRQDAQELIRSVAGNFQAFPVWSNGKISLAQDRPAVPVWAFTQANVIVDVNGDIESQPFEYSQVDISSRFTAADVAYVDATIWDIETEEIKDNALIATYGFKNKEISLFGCTSRGQAVRQGRWEIFTSNYNDEVVSFKAARDALPLEIGDVIEIFDKFEQGIKLGGRVVDSPTTTTVTLDQSYNLTGAAHDLSILYPDGTQQSRDIVSVVGAIATVASPYSTRPEPGNLYVIRRTDISPTLWRILSIDEEEEEIFGIQASKYAEGKWAYIEDGTLLPERRTSILRVNPSPPINLKTTIFLSKNDTGGLRIKGGFEWQPPTTGVGVVGYDVRWRKQPAIDYTQATTQSLSIDIDFELGVYELQVRSVSSLNFKSKWAGMTKDVDFSQDITANVTNFSLNPQSSSLAQLSWDRASQEDVRVAGLLRLKFSSSGAGWANAIFLQDYSGASQSGTAPLLDGTYYAKWIDPFGKESLNAASIATQNLGILAKNIVATIIEHPDFNGTKTRCYVTEAGFLTIAPTLLWDSQTGNFDDDTTTLIDDVGRDTLEADAIYDFDNSLVLPDIQDVSLVADYQAFSSDSLVLFDDAPGNFDNRVGNFDGGVEGAAEIDLQVRTSQDGVTFGEWQNFTVGIFRFLAAEFRALLTSEDSQNISVVTLNVRADVDDRAEVGLVTTNAGGDTNITFSRPFVAAPPNGVAYSIQGGTTEDQVDITALTKNGFTINVYRSGARISRVVRWATESY